MRTPFKILELKSLKKNKLIQVSEFLDKNIPMLWKYYGSDFTNSKLAQFEFDSMDFNFNELPYGKLIYSYNDDKCYIFLFEDEQDTILIECIQNNEGLFIGNIYNVNDFYLHVMFKVCSKLFGRYSGVTN